MSRDYRAEAIKVIDKYLSGAMDKDEASKWAIDIVASKDFDNLPYDTQNAIHLLFDLHDNEDDPWFPTRKDLEESKAAMLLSTP